MELQEFVCIVNKYTSESLFACGCLTHTPLLTLVKFAFAGSHFFQCFAASAPRSCIHVKLDKFSFFFTWWTELFIFLDYRYLQGKDFLSLLKADEPRLPAEPYCRSGSVITPLMQCFNLFIFKLLRSFGNWDSIEGTWESLWQWLDVSSGRRLLAVEGRC